MHEADILVITLGADYDVSSAPGVVLGQNEFYSVAGAAHLAGVLSAFKAGMWGYAARPENARPRRMHAR